MMVTFGPADALLIAKILDMADDAMLADAGFTRAERERAEWIFEDMDGLLDRRYPTENWAEMEVL